MENKTKKISLGFVLAIALAGFVMRSPITTLPMILENLAQRLHVNPANLGILTTIPLVIFMVVSNFAAKTVAWLGLKRTLTMALAMIFVGGGIRVVNQFELVVLGTILIGLGIAHLNVLMPAFLMAYVPNKIALYTTAYSLVMMFGVAVFNLVTAPIVHFAGVTAVMLVLLVVSGLALLVWLISMNRAQAVGEVGHQPQPKMPQKKQLNAWRQLRAWPFLVVFGGQALLNYTFVAWMPTLMSFHHLTPSQVGFAMSLNAFVGMFISTIIPNLLVQLSNRGISYLILGTGGVGLIGAVMLFFQNTSSIVFWSIESIIIGIVTGFFFMSLMTLFALKTNDPMASASLAGMAQTGGYLIGALGPVLYGMAFAAKPTGVLQNVIYVGVILMITIMGWFVANTKKFET